MSEIAPLSDHDVEELSALWQGQRAEYLRYFHPFGSAPEELRAVLTGAVQDRFWSLREAGKLAGFFMLRGWDSGFARPAFGVLVAEEFAGRGLARRALEFSLNWCEARHIPSLMLTVHSENRRARLIYEAAGFLATGSFSSSGDEIFERMIPETSASRV